MFKLARTVITILCMHVLIFNDIFVMNFISIASRVINISIIHKCTWVLELYINIVTEVLKNSDTYL